MYQDLRARHDCSVENTIVDLPIKTKENSKQTSGNFLSPLGAQNKNIGAALQTSLRVDFQCRVCLLAYVRKIFVRKYNKGNV